MLRRIVTGVDGGEGGRDAAVLARALAVTSDADVLLVGVWPESLLPIPVLLEPGVHPIEDIERMLLDVRAEHVPSGITRPLSDLSPARALRRTASREHADVLALGSSQHAPRGHACAGIDARQAVQDAPCAVALAARGIRRAPFALRRIVVGVDGTPESDAALALASALGAALVADLMAVAVVDDTVPRRMAPFGARATRNARERVGPQQREHAERVVEQARTADRVVIAETRVGDPARELARAAADADLLALGSRRWGHEAHVVLGSTGEALLRDAPCSLLIAPRPAAAG